MATSDYTGTRPAPEPPPAPPPETPGAEPCAQCGAPLRADQEWCLQCGASRTLIYPPPDWRLPVAVAAVVVVIAVLGFAYALNQLSGDATRTAAANAAAVTINPGASIAVAGRGASTAASTATAPSGTTTSSQVQGVASWPVGLDGWTVVLARKQSEADAYARAHQIAPTDPAVGVLNSSDHPSMRPGYWIVFSGRYPGRAEAKAASANLIADGYTGARARRVAPPGGL